MIPLFYYYYFKKNYYNLVFDIQLLQMINYEQAIDINGISERCLTKNLGVNTLLILTFWANSRFGP